MRILIITQKIDINDDVLGFFHGWVREFAKHCEKVTVICLYKGEYDLPENVKVLSLGKEKNKSFPLIRGIEGVKKIKYIFRFYKYIWQERKNYDAVFVHMNQIYVILGAWFWRLQKNKIALWYTHKQVSLALRIAEKFVDKIFTASRESFRLASKKLIVMGHGIDTEIFKPLENKKENNVFKILTVGRISPIKDIKTLVRAVGELQNSNYELQVVGAAGTLEQEKYFQEVKDLVKELKLKEKVKFIGSVPNREVRQYYQTADLFVNMAPTGGLDKAILEATACACPVIVCNETMKNDLGEFADELMFKHGDCKELAEKIKKIINLDQSQRIIIAKKLRERVTENHNLENLVKKILAIFYE